MTISQPTLPKIDKNLAKLAKKSHESLIKMIATPQEKQVNTFYTEHVETLPEDSIVLDQ